jgi:epoxyqueuosine reductase
MFLGFVLTTADLRKDKPSHGGCGTCTKCIDACPTGAIVQFEKQWALRADRCISYLTIEHNGEIDEGLQTQIGDWTYGCDICQEVCPFNEQRDSQPMRSEITKESDFFQPPKSSRLIELSNFSFEKWDEFTRGRALRRANQEMWQRNAKINLKNKGQT